MDAAHRDGVYSRSACTECARRKQKCNREWPCDRCHKRKIADQCRYSVPSPPVSDDAIDVLTPQEKQDMSVEAQVENGVVVSNTEYNSGLHTLASHLFSTLGIGHQSKEPLQTLDYVEYDSSPQLEHALQLLPPRQLMDDLIDVFIHDVNYHYYIIYPPVFLNDYQIWWDKKSKRQPISLQWTCLLVMVSACAVQHLDNTLQQTFEREVDATIDVYSEKLHNAGRELASVIPVGHYHFLNVQRLLHSCYWYKAEAKFPEAWHVLNTAILEARELGFHTEPTPGLLSDFDVEMRRRVWCILDTWDWQISSGLGRPIIIDRAECDTKLPVLTLEGYALSPLLHMKMQAQLTRSLTPQFRSPKDIVTPRQIIDYKDIVEDWVQRFPPAYNSEYPDKTWDKVYPWLFPHRFYVFTMACLMILNPVRAYMVQQYSLDAQSEELQVRAIGIEYSLKVMDTLREWVASLSRRDGRLHFIIFSIFDTAAILCTALIKNPGNPIPEQDKVLVAITDAVDMLKSLNRISKTSKASHTILCKLVRRLPQRPISSRNSRQKRARVMESPNTNPPQLPIKIETPQATMTSCAVEYQNPPVVGTNAMPQNHVVAVDNVGLAPVGMPPMNHVPATQFNPPPPVPMGPDPSAGTYIGHSLPPAPPAFISMDPVPVQYGSFQQPQDEPLPEFSLENIPPSALGELGPIWNWHSSNLDIVNTNGAAPSMTPPHSNPPHSNPPHNTHLHNNLPLSQ